MSSSAFEIRGTEELKGKLEALMNQYPAETRQELEKCANDFKKDVNKKFPHGGTSGKRKSVSKTWEKTELMGVAGMTYGVELQNQAPHFHLVENGHELWVDPELYAAMKSGTFRKKRNSKSSSKKSTNLVHKGFVPGKHYCEKTRNEWNDGKFQKRVDKHIKKLLKKHDLT
jgi:hypothetical protein